MCRKVYDYIRYDLKEIAFPSSLPDPPHIKKRLKLTWHERFLVLKDASRLYAASWVKDIGPDLRPHDYKKDERSEGKPSGDKSKTKEAGPSTLKDIAKQELAEDNEESDRAVCVQPQKALPSANPHASDLFVTSSGSQRIVNNHAFSHASTGSGFHPFIQPKASACPGHQLLQSQITVAHVAASFVSGSANAQATEREESEWSDAEGSADVYGNSSLHEEVKASQEIAGENGRESKHGA